MVRTGRPRRSRTRQRFVGGICEAPPAKDATAPLESSPWVAKEGLSVGGFAELAKATEKAFRGFKVNVLGVKDNGKLKVESMSSSAAGKIVWLWGNFDFIQNTPDEALVAAWGSSQSRRPLNQTQRACHRNNRKTFVVAEVLPSLAQPPRLVQAADAEAVLGAPIPNV